MIKLDLTSAQNIWRHISPANGSFDQPSARLANEIALEFMADFAADTPPDLNHINLLCQMAASPDSNLAKSAVSALYGIVIEGLSDDFTTRGVELCNSVLLHILSYLRQNNLVADIHRQLNKLGYFQSKDLLARYKRITAHPMPPSGPVKKVFILSRVTIGADVAITSVIAWRLRQALANAEIIIIGPDHLHQIFHNLPGSRVIPLASTRRGSLLERFSAWPKIYGVVKNETRGLAAGEFLLFDPESRLSQLGLLPLTDEESTFLFNSRSMRPQGNKRSLSALVNQWLDDLLGEKKSCFPQVSLDHKQVEKCRLFCHQLRANGCRRIIAINFGVGEDKRKRLPDPFEEKIITALLNLPQTILLLDTGSGSEEKGRVEKLLSLGAIKNISQQRLTGNNFATGKTNFSHGIISLQDSVGGFGAMLNEADIYLGYDSCFQHMANASTTPAVIIFRGHPNERFIARWSPENLSKSTKIIPVADNQAMSSADICALATEVNRALENLFEKRSSN